MIGLTDVKVAPQYRERVRHRLVVLTYAGTHGPTAASRRYGISAEASGAGESVGGLRESRDWYRGIPTDASAG